MRYFGGLGYYIFSGLPFLRGVSQGCCFSQLEVYRKSIGSLSNIHRTSIEYTSLEQLSSRKSIDHQSNIYRKSFEGQSKAYRKSIGNLPSIHRTAIEHSSNSYRIGSISITNRTSIGMCSIYVRYIGPVFDMCSIYWPWGRTLECSAETAKRYQCLIFLLFFRIVWHGPI